MSFSSPASGGFLPTLPSPPKSTISTLTTSHHLLPSTRSHPLKPGSSKEGSVIAYIDKHLLEIGRRYEKRSSSTLFGRSGGDDGGRRRGGGEGGYKNFHEVATDLLDLLNVVWTTGTRKFSSNRPFSLSSTPPTSPLPPRQAFLS